MNTEQKRVPTRFAPDTRFDLAPTPAVPFRGTLENELERLKNRLLRQLLEETTDPQFYAPIRRAANEAAALAWMTPYPFLVLPLLLEEKAGVARLQAVRQELIRQRSRGLLMELA